MIRYFLVDECQQYISPSCEALLTFFHVQQRRQMIKIGGWKSIALDLEIKHYIIEFWNKFKLCISQTADTLIF